MKDYLKWIILGGIFAIPFLSFVVLQDTFFPYIVGKNFGFRVIVEIIFGAWIVLAYLDKAYRPKLSFITAAILSLVVIMGLSALLGSNPERSFWSNYERMDGYITTIHLFAYFLVTSSIMTTKKQWEWLFHTMVAASVILGFMGLKEVFSPGFTGDRIATTLGNPIYLAVYMLFHMFLSVYYLSKESMRNWKISHYLYVGALIVQTLNLYYAGTRGTILGLIGGLFLIGLVLAVFEKKNKGLQKIAISLVGGVVLVVGLFFVLRHTPFIQNSPILNRFNAITVSDANGNIEPRFIIWGMALKGFEEKPILGWGQENFPYVFNKYYDPRLYLREPWFDRAHNVFLDWLITGGILGLSAYLSIFVAALYLIWKKKDDDFSLLTKAIFIGLLAAYFFHNIFVFDHLVSYILFFTFLAYIHVRKSDVSHQNTFDGLKKKIEGLFAKWDDKGKDVGFISGVVIFAVVFTIYILNYIPYQQNKTIIEALSALQDRTPQEQNPQEQQIGVEQSLAFYKKALAYDSFGDDETRERLIISAQQIYGIQNISENVRQEYLNFAISEANKEVIKMTGDSKYPLFASSLYLVRGDYQSAIDMLKKAQTYSPKKDLVLTALGNAYMSTGDYQNALDVYKEEYTNAPKNISVALQYARTAILTKNDKLADEIYASVRDEYIKSIVSEPANPNYRFQLAGVYLQLGQRDKVVETLEKALVDFPDDASVQNSAKSYIDQIKKGTL